MSLEQLPTTKTIRVSSSAPTASTLSVSSTKSWPSSLQGVVRPVTSKTRLLRTRSSDSRFSKEMAEASSLSSPSQPDGFDTWETSTIHPQLREAVMQSNPNPSRTVLEPIPGSRPLTPIPNLDGQSPAEEDPLTTPESTEESSVHSSSPTPAHSESHIHPLFRSDTPDPPPVAMPGTIVTASPLSGQAVPPPAPYSRGRARSLSRTASPLVTSRASSAPTSRSSTPPVREQMPPIPGFILSAFLHDGYGKRKSAESPNCEQ